MGIFGVLSYLSGVASLDERKRILLNKTDYLVARMQDIKREISYIQGKKRKRDHAIWDWMADGEKLVEKARCVLREVGKWRGFLVGDARMRWNVSKLIDDMRDHDKIGVVLLNQALSDARGLCHGLHLPVKQVVGQEASETLDQLKLLLEGDKAGRIAIHGEKGIGKTFLMKHLHNYALGRFDYVFWVSSPDKFTVKCVQDAVAAVVKCDLSSDDLNVRAAMLRHKLAGLGSFAIFLDGVADVHESDISMDLIGIIVPAAGSKCKVVLSTSTLRWRMFKRFAAVKVERLSEDAAWQLFKLETGIGKDFVSSLVDMPRLLVKTCCGLPHKIVNLATYMCGKVDPREWRYELSQSGCHELENKFPIIPELERENKRLKKDIIHSPMSLGWVESAGN